MTADFRTWVLSARYLLRADALALLNRAASEGHRHRLYAAQAGQVDRLIRRVDIAFKVLRPHVHGHTGLRHVDVTAHCDRHFPLIDRVAAGTAKLRGRRNRSLSRRRLAQRDLGLDRGRALGHFSPGRGPRIWNDALKFRTPL